MHIQRNLRAIVVFDVLTAIMDMYLVWYRVFYKPSFEAHMEIVLTVCIGILALTYIAAGIGLLQRKEWARLLHYPLLFLVIFSKATIVSVIAVVAVYIISTKEVKDYCKKNT